MKGLIRAVLGLMILFGVVGTMEADPTADMYQVTFAAFVGVGMALWALRDLMAAQRR